MARKGPAGPGGLVVVDKPAGMTSHDVVGRVRRIAGTRRVGHAGTLDPMATGVLVLGVERATKLMNHLTLTDKSYLATVRLGIATSTDDAEGTVLSAAPAGGLDPAAIASAMGALTGEILQRPSSVSAIKVDGERAYARVRAGETVQLAARPVTVSRFELLAPPRPAGKGAGPDVPDRDVPDRDVPDPDMPARDMPDRDVLDRDVLDRDMPDRDVLDRDVLDRDMLDRDMLDLDVLDLDVAVDCTSGTYVRALARDLGELLGVGGHLTALRRTRVGPFGLDQALTLDQLAELADPVVLPLPRAIEASMPVRRLTAAEVVELAYGRPIAPAGIEGTYGGIAETGEAVALLAESGGRARPVLGFTRAG